MKISRRQLLQSSLASAALAATPQSLLAAAQTKLPIPPLASVGRGKPIFLTMQSTQYAFNTDKMVEVWGFNGAYLGPTIKMKQGDFVKLSYANNLNEAVAINVQGLLAKGDIFTGIARVLQPKQTWSPIVLITQSAATCWYHADTIGRSAYQSYRGLVGMWIIEDNDSRKAQLPNNYGVNDIPLILQDMSINHQGKQLFNLQQKSFAGKQLFVNGVVAPYIDVAKGLVRLRIVNASTSRSYLIGLDNEQPLYLIARGLGFLPQPQKLQRVLLTPGERIEVLLDISGEQSVRLITGEKRGFFDDVLSLFSGEDQLDSNVILELRPQGLVSAFDNQLPALPAAQLDFNLTPIQQREFTLDTENAMINQQRFDIQRIDTKVQLNSVERWILRADSPIGFRIQGAKFLLERENQRIVEDSELSWRDCVWIDKEVSILVKFEHSSSNNYPFIYSTTNMLLADKGLMGTLLVQ